MLFNKWKPQPKDCFIKDHGYSLVSNYYICKRIKGVIKFKITRKGIYKLKEGNLEIETHNFMVYLAGKGDRKVSSNEFESGRVI